MNLLQHLARLLTYDHWANREALESLKRLNSAPPERSLKLIAHVIEAQWLWLSRLKEEGKTVYFWPDLTLDQCEDRLAGLPAAWKGYLNGITVRELTRPISYVNTKGEPWTSWVQDIVMHVITHSAYHRGQIAAELRAAGREPAYTDFVHAVRSGFVD